MLLSIQFEIEIRNGSDIKTMDGIAQHHSHMESIFIFIATGWHYESTSHAACSGSSQHPHISRGQLSS